MKKLTLIFVALIFALIAVGQTSTLIEYPYVVKHMGNKDQIFTATPGKYFVGYNTISQGDSVLYYSTSGLSTGLGTYASPLPIDSINTLKSNGKKVLARIKRGDTYGVITIPDSNIVVCSYSTVNTTEKPVINYIDYNGKANIEVKNINQTYNGYRFVSNNGNDTYPGTKPDSAWATIAKVNASTFAAGDFIVFERGDVWRESLTVPSSGTAGSPIVFGAYGTGADPVIDGADVINVTQAYVKSTGWSATHNSYSAPYHGNVRQVVNVTGTGSAIRIVVRGTASNGFTQILGCSIGLRSGTTDDFSGTPTRITFAGKDTITAPQGGTFIYSDWIPLSVTNATDYLVHFYISSTSAISRVSSGGSYSSTSTADNTLTQTINYGGVETQTRIITRLDVQGSALTNTWKKEGVTVQPNIVFLNDTIGIPQASIAAVDTSKQWFWDTADKTFYIYNATNPSGNVEIGQRKKIVDVGNKQYVTISNLTIQHSNELNTKALYDNEFSALNMVDGNNLTVTGCTIQNNAYAGVYIKNSSNLTFTNNMITSNGKTHNRGHNVWINSTAVRGVTNLTFTNNTITNAGHFGLYIRGSSDANRPVKGTVSGNTFDYNIGTGLYLSSVDSFATYNNYFYRNGNAADDAEDYHIGLACADNTDIYNNTLIDQLYNDAIQIYSDTLAANGSSHNVRIFRNYIDSVSNGSCIGIIQFHNASMNNLQIFYNFLGNATGNPTLKSGIQLIHNGVGTPDTVYVWNNTIVNNNYGITEYTNKKPIVLKNNIFSNNTSQQVNMFQIASGLVHSNNLFYKTTGASLQYAGATYDTPAEILTFEPTAQTTDPLFVGSGTYPYSLQTGSPAINAGVEIPGLPDTDILGNPIVGNPDIGAYEKQ